MHYHQGFKLVNGKLAALPLRETWIEDDEQHTQTISRMNVVNYALLAIIIEAVLIGLAVWWKLAH